ncbi:MAG: tetratricopeptide repeat protein [Planctomycetota bacterium]
MRQWVREGKLVVIGIAQEQHSDRSRFFAQWHQFDWPIVHDPINVMQVRGVPIEVAIDEHGIVRSIKPKPDTLKAEFLDKSFEADDGQAPGKPVKPTRPDLEALRLRAEQSGTADAWRELGDALVLWAGPAGAEEAIKAYTQAINIKPDDGDAHFRLGVCYRMRYDSARRMPSDFQTAVDHWTKARQIEPNQYIWRRRIEQYGPRLTKPYPFYDWVETAADEIRARGEKPVELEILPTGSEIAAPDRSFDSGQSDVKPPDPQGRIHRDAQGLVLAEVTVVPPRIKPGEIVRVHVTLRPNEKQKAHWNNEAEPLKLWVDPPAGWQVQPQLLIAPQGEEPETSEPRRLEFEVRTPAGASGTTELAAYALYYACEDVNGTCQFLRLDISVKVTVDE